MSNETTEKQGVSAEALERRATEAEAKLGEAQSRLSELEESLAKSREALDAAERRAEIERELARADAIDLEAARLLTEAAVAEMEDPDVSSAISELRKRKPHLFSSRSGRRTSAMGAIADPAPRGRATEEAAAEARATGDRRALLEYLRAKRG